MARESFDLVVIGGGITGAGIAWEATARGLKTALIDKNDFASGTSSKSSKLVHGGMRYLRQGDIRLTLAMARERAVLQRLAPGVVDWVGFLFPFYGAPSDWLLASLGLWIYDLLAWRSIPLTHRRVSPQEAARLWPQLQERGLKAAFTYFDGRTDDARLVLTVLKAAARQGALIANYAAAIGFLRCRQRVAGVVVRDVLTGQELEIRSMAVVNASGPWLDEVRHCEDRDARPLLFTTKGIHLVVRREHVLARRSAEGDFDLGLLFRSACDGREMFVIPWGPLALIGTTDTPYTGDPADARAHTEDITYVLDSINGILKTRLRPEEILATFAGVRPLLAQDKPFASDISRWHRISESSSGLISIGGGKLTTFRLMGRAVVDRVMKRLAWSQRARRDRDGVPGRATSQRVRGDPLWAPSLLLDAANPDLEEMPFDPDIRDHLARAYGQDARSIFELTRSHSELGDRLIPGLPYIKAEVLYAMRREMALTLTDVLSRRTRLVWEDAEHALPVAESVAQLMARELGWPEQEIAAQLAAYRREALLHSVAGAAR